MTVIIGIWCTELIKFVIPNVLFYAQRIWCFPKVKDHVKIPEEFMPLTWIFTRWEKSVKITTRLKTKTLGNYKVHHILISTFFSKLRRAFMLASRKTTGHVTMLFEDYCSGSTSSISSFISADVYSVAIIIGNFRRTILPWQSIDKPQGVVLLFANRQRILLQRLQN